MRKGIIANYFLFIEKPYQKELFRLLRIENMVQIYFLSLIGLCFLIPFSMLDYFRWTNGKLPGVFIYEMLFYTHMLFLLFLIPILILRYNASAVKDGSYRYSTTLIYVWTLLIGFLLTSIAVLSFWERGSLIMYAIYILLLNSAILMLHFDRILFNLISYAIIAIAIMQIDQGNTELMLTNLIEAAGITIPSFAISTHRFNNFIKTIRAEKLLQDKNDQIEKEINRSDALLLNILPAKVAEELKLNGKVRPRHYSSATIMFLDIVGFSNLSKSLTPEQLVEDLDYCFSKFDNIVAEFNMEKIKTMGDAYICIGGVPESNSSHPFDAIKAAQRLYEFLDQWKAEKIKKQEPYFEARIGLHTGPVIAGIVGSHKLAFDVWGDAVNIASRVESSSNPWRINISESTYLLIQNKYQCEARGKISTKNTGDINMYFVDGPKYTV